MKKLGGWQRLTLVFSIGAALICTGLGMRSYQIEAKNIYASSQALISHANSPDGKLDNLEKSMLASLQKRQESNFEDRVRNYGALWIFSVLLFGVVVAVTRFVCNGFKAREQ